MWFLFWKYLLVGGVDFGVRFFYFGKGFVIELDIVSFIDGGVSESCLEEVFIEFSSEEYRFYLIDEVG